MITTRKIALITDYSTLTTPKLSNKIYIGDAYRVGIQFNQTGHSTGNIAFTVQGSMENYDTVSPTMTDINILLDNVTNTNSQTPTRVNGKTLSSSNDATIWLEKRSLLSWIQVTAVITTDGHANAWLIVERE